MATADTPSRLADLVAGVSMAGLLLPEAVAWRHLRSSVAGTVMPDQPGR